jgi:hypothetical protein
MSRNTCHSSSLSLERIILFILERIVFSLGLPLRPAIRLGYKKSANSPIDVLQQMRSARNSPYAPSPGYHGAAGLFNAGLSDILH